MGKPDNLIDHVLTFIQNERELYGDFLIDQSLQGQTDETGKAQQVHDLDPPSSNNSSQTVTEPQDTSYNEDEAKGSIKEHSPSSIYDRIDECDTLEALEQLCKEADVLRTDLEGTQLVFGVGNPEADLMLIGKAPGAEEDRQGEPFVGKAGQLLNDILAAINFDREDVYIANILKHRPPNNRNPKPEERKRSLPFLLRQIDLINPKLILSLGKVSAQTLLDKDSSLSSMRGQFHSFRNNYELLATYHPAALLRHAKWKRPTWEDVQLLRKRYDEVKGRP
ncbi:uracil-DNA glycosylase [Fodinibius salsisoli]|uniref:Type-4 uracil-DNA glycosylase n=1 Tax=Fodinibius salsisoli TaxID=2820877 RepID=A0ABT3PLC0_9BACT|nr:uracil-DNA glycosylase [Fodinibius salsisoli]MCW9706745.1 uracil-DNA glycosylase [Fodinibius salsisoli]